MEPDKFFVDEGSKVPVYAQLGEQVLAAIGRGSLRRGDRLPSVRDVAAALAINPHTVNRAYAELERDGAIETRRGKGTFVASPRGGTAAVRRRGANLPDIAQRFVNHARALGFEASQILNAVATQLGKHSKESP
jgi:GntR family transcriptional regulator